MREDNTTQPSLEALAAQWVAYKIEVERLEAVKLHLQTQISNLLGKEQAKHAGGYVVKRVTQDRRSPDLEKITALVVKRDVGDIEAILTKPNAVMITKDGAALLLESGALSPADVAANMKGSIISFIDVKPAKEEKT